MKLRQYVVDAFTDRRFRGNPAAVVPLERWLDDVLMQSIALENHLSETAFFVREGDHWRIRWFTPASEVDLCGHATLAAAFVLTTLLEPALTRVTFASRGGTLTATREGDRFALDFPARHGVACAVAPGLAAALGVTPLETHLAVDLMAVLASEAEVRAVRPDFTAIAALGVRGLIVTAPGEDCDFVSRFFAPAVGVPEDPVTGSAHCTLAPYWAARLGKNSLHARQVSARGGELWCELRGERVKIAGHAVKYLEGEIEV